VHEAREELGLEVALGPLVAVAGHDGDQQFHFLARVIAGSGDGPEMDSSADSEEGSYRPVRLRLSALHEHDVRPKALAAALSADPVLADSQVLHIKD